MATELYSVRSLSSTQFTEALGVAVNGAGVGPFVASAIYNLPGLPMFNRRFIIRAIEVLATQNFGPEVNIFGSAAGPTLNVDTDSFIARFGFTSALGEQIGGANLWRYYIDGLAIPYEDLDTKASNTPPTIHVLLQNIDTVAKSAGSPGAISVIIWVELMKAY
jgi:hypothetical protein